MKLRERSFVKATASSTATADYCVLAPEQTAYKRINSTHYIKLFQAGVERDPQIVQNTTEL
jgi:hypothetical protein